MSLQKNNQNSLCIRSISLLLFLSVFFDGFAQNGVAINTTGAAADNSAILDLSNSVNKGLLLPQVANLPTSAAAPATALVVYKTGSASGIYCNIGTPTSPNWILLGSASGNNNYIQNQNTASQTANFWVSGPASIGTANVNTQQLAIATSTASYIGLYAQNTAAAGTGIGTGVEGITGQSNGNGVYGVNTNVNGVGVLGYCSPTSSTGTGAGVYGQTAQSQGFATIGFNTNSAGTGVGGAGNNSSLYYLTAGSGAAFTGTLTGVYAKNTSNAASQSIYAENGNGAGLIVCRVNYWSGATQYKILGSGTVSTTASNLDNTSKVVLHAPETPEIYFEDYGEAKLVNGKAHINMDPLLTKNVAINDKHPLRVFIQLEGECNGVYVTNKSATGFDVVELQKGTSSVNFQWHIVCNRADELLPNGKVSHNADIRFEAAPKDENTSTISLLKRIATPHPVEN